MKNARTRHPALSLFVSISVAGTMFAGASSTATANVPFDMGNLGAPDIVSSAHRACAAGLGLWGGDLAVAAGMVFVLPQGAVAFEGTDVEAQAWIDESAGLFVAAIPQAATGVTDLSLGDLVAAATDLAVSMDGAVTGFSVYDNEGATVYVYDVAFAREGVDLRASLGFVPLGDGTMSALVGIWRDGSGMTAQPLMGDLYAGVDLVW